MTGLVVARGDDAALADGALQLLRDSALAVSVADAARAECLGRYTWPVVRDQWMDLYSTLANRRRAVDADPLPTARA